MNLRKDQLAELIVSKMEALTIDEGSLIVVRLPNGLSSQTSQSAGDSIVQSLRAMGKTNPVLLLPDKVQIQTLNDQDMKELGWIRDGKTTTTQSNVSMCGLQRPKESEESSKYLYDTSRLRSGKASDVPPGGNISGVLGSEWPDYPEYGSWTT
jgi:hypothetical protein